MNVPASMAAADHRPASRPADPADRVRAAQRQLAAHRQRVTGLTHVEASSGDDRHPWVDALIRRWQGLRHSLDALWAVQRGDWGDAAAAGLAHSASQRPFLTVAMAAAAGGLLAWAAPRLWRWWLLPLVFAEGRAWLHRHTVNTVSSWVERTRASRGATQRQTPTPPAPGGPKTVPPSVATPQASHVHTGR